ncbi:erythromycin esterase family protein [Streptomyces sp. NPDC006530]|uniref:erythromycin esterase family protein n=1 Tax=Streptomyces sp. NPDC006530 TaxID=3364750 RepID=UPI0036D02FBE
MNLFTDSPHRSRQVLLLLLTLCLGLLTAAPAARAAPRPPGPAGPSDPVRELARQAVPLTDLRPLGRMTAAADIVGLGEATHNSHEFFATKQRVFQYLVEQRGFTTFALEVSWSSGLRVNDYVRYGRGDPERIVREEFQGSYTVWDTQEYLDLIRWMRGYNLRHHTQVQFMGDDMGYAGPALFDRVTAYTARHYPKLLPEIDRLYRQSRPTAGVGDTMMSYLRRPMAERRQMAADTARAHALLSAQSPGADAEEFDWVVQYARTIAQTGRQFGYDFDDPEQLRASRGYRDRVMAENTLWWQRHTGHRMLLSAHNGHVGYEPTGNGEYPKMQGAFLREAIGSRYVNIGFTFGQGSFNAFDLNDPAEPIRTFSVPPLGAGSNEEVLERVSPRDYYLDLRSASRPARSWLAVTRPTRSIGNAWPADVEQTSLGASFDILVHLHRVRAADRL